MSIADAVVTTAVQTLANDPDAREQLWTAMRAAGIPFPSSPAPAPSSPPPAPPPSWDPLAWVRSGSQLTASPGTGMGGWLPSEQRDRSTIEHALIAASLPVQARVLEERNAVEMQRWRVDQESERLARERRAIEQREREVQFAESGGKSSLKLIGVGVGGGLLGFILGWAWGSLSATRAHPPRPLRRWR